MSRIETGISLRVEHFMGATPRESIGSMCNVARSLRLDVVCMIGDVEVRAQPYSEVDHLHHKFMMASAGGLKSASNHYPSYELVAEQQRKMGSAGQVGSAVQAPACGSAEVGETADRLVPRRKVIDYGPGGPVYADELSRPHTGVDP